MLTFIKKLYERTKETYWRSIVKSLAYRIYSSFIVTPLVTYFMTGNLTLGFSVGVAELLIKPFTYFVFERAFCHLRWGYKQNPKAKKNLKRE